jgi:hypothetical protein
MAKRSLGIEEIAAEVGRLFGKTEVHARRWLDQRRELADALSVVRDKAAHLISELDGTGGFRWPTNGKRKQGTPVVQPAMRESRRKRVISAQTRAKMRAAAKKRWAALKAKKTT